MILRNNCKYRKIKAYQAGDNYMILLPRLTDRLNIVELSRLIELVSKQTVSRGPLVSIYNQYAGYWQSTGTVCIRCTYDIWRISGCGYTLPHSIDFYRKEFSTSVYKWREVNLTTKELNFE
jgi:hypothetical protein